MDQEAVFSSMQSELFAHFGPDGSCSKMSEDCFPGMMEQISEPFCGSWPTRGTMRNGRLYAPTSSAIPTGASGSSSWPIPQSIPENKASRGALLGDYKRRMMEAMQCWQPPAADSFRSRGGDRKAEMGLDQEARNWPTPRAITGGPESAKRKQELGRTSSGGGDLQALATAPDGLQSSPNAPGSRQRLNPTFVETLLGFPVGWTLTAENDSRRLEMQSCPPVADGLESKS